MTHIMQMVNRIDEELEDAKTYAEIYLELKAREEYREQSLNHKKWASTYKELALDELKHAGIIHERAAEEIAELEKVFKPTSEMLKIWQESHVEYVEKAAWIKKMLEM